LSATPKVIVDSIESIACCKVEPKRKTDVAVVSFLVEFSILSEECTDIMVELDLKCSGSPKTETFRRRCHKFVVYVMNDLLDAGKVF
jgi:hypothetical protein